MLSKSLVLKVRVRTMSRFIETASFGSCPAVLILCVQKRTSEGPQPESNLPTHQLVYDFGSVSGRNANAYMI
jgi:hypothetical protein